MILMKKLKPITSSYYIKYQILQIGIKTLLDNIIKSETALFFIGGKGNNWSEFNKFKNS